MDNLEYSELLKKLIVEAKKLVADADLPVFDDCLVLVAVDRILNRNGGLTDKERYEMRPLTRYFELRKINVDELAKQLHDYADSHKNRDPMEAILAGRGVVKTHSEALENGQTTITAGDFMVSLMKYPSRPLERCIKASTVREGHDDDDMEDLLMSILTESQDPDDDNMDDDDDLFKDPAPKEVIEDLIDFVKRTRTAILDKVFGQDKAVSVFIDGYFQGELSALVDNERTRPRATFLFAGPPGVGKTYLAETAAKQLDIPFQRFDMSEYSDKECVVMLTGAEGVYRDSKPGVLTEYVDKHPRCILLFDEIEKAHINAIHLFLQILDAGRLRDAKMRKEVSFTDTIVIFTTNAGKRLYEEAESGDLSTISRKVILNALEKDINPDTKEPLFPKAICSRFASGNVVMFNNLFAGSLLNVAKDVMCGQAKKLEEKTGIRSPIDPKVFTAMLLAEGGDADARMIRGRSLFFYNSELFELFRLVDSEKVSTDVKTIEEVAFKVELPEDPEVRSLFVTPNNLTALVFGGGEVAEWCRANQSTCTVMDTQDYDDGVKMLSHDSISFVMIDMDLKRVAEESGYLNVEDIDSSSRNFLWHVRENYGEMPIYLLVKPDDRLTEEERLSFQRLGVRDFIKVYEDESGFADFIAGACSDIHHQNSISALARSNKLISFETGQKISDDGKKAEIVLFDFEMETAVDADDMKDVLSKGSRPVIPFDDVIGADGAKKELQYFVNYLRNPKMFEGTGVSTPKGVLLYGPPGTGKTMLAKAMAYESGVTFFATEGNRFIKPLVGEGPQALHDLFSAARRYAPSIIFIDEVEAIVKKRGIELNSSSRDEVLTALLTEMDGFKKDPKKPVFVLAATNYDAAPGKPTDLDEAVLRRFDRRIEVELPNRENRIKYLKKRMARSPRFAVSDEMLENIAIRATGMSLAQLESMTELAMRNSVRTNASEITDEMFEEAFETFTNGDEKKWDERELLRTARHESGHAFLSWKSGDKPEYVTIVSRGDHGGYMQRGGAEAKGTFTKEELLALIRTGLGGRAAEMFYYGKDGGLSTGASADLTTATSIARNIICRYGMDEDFGLAASDGSETMSPEVRAAVNRILSTEMENALTEISENKEAVERLVKELLDKDRLTGAEIDRILSEK